MQEALHRLRRAASRGFIRSRALRELMGRAYYRRSRQRPYDLAHLSLFGDREAIGPLQRDEALLLYALTRVVRPRVVVEMGFLWGRSALNFLLALPPGAHLHSFDISPEAAGVAREQFSGLENFTFHPVSQADIAPHHVGGRQVDLVLLDAAHELELNQQTFEALEDMLSPSAIVAVHDTGTWPRERMTQVHHEFAAAGIGGGTWLPNGEYQHQPGERRFVNWILDEHKDYDLLHLHTTATLRHGLTLIQRRAPLPVETA